MRPGSVAYVPRLPVVPEAPAYIGHSWRPIVPGGNWMRPGLGPWLDRLPVVPGPLAYIGHSWRPIVPGGNWRPALCAYVYRLPIAVHGRRPDKCQEGKSPKTRIPIPSKAPLPSSFFNPPFGKWFTFELRDSFSGRIRRLQRDAGPPGGLIRGSSLSVLS
jgi:hypothetical protein